MNKMITILVFFVFMTVVVPFVLPLKDGKPLLNFSEMTMPKGPKLPDIDLPSFSSSDQQPSAPVNFYSWTDANGETHIQNTPPPEGIAYKVNTVNPDANIMKHVTPQPYRPKTTDKQAAAVSQSSMPMMTADPKKLMEDVANLKESIENRTNEIDSELKKY